MIRALAGLLVLALAGLPVLAAPSWPIASVGAATALVGAAGVVRFSPPLLTAGGVLGLVQYGLALWLTAAPPDLLSAVALGVVLSLLIAVADVAARFRRAAVDARVFRAEVRDWAGSAAVEAAAGVVLVVAAGALSIDLPAWAYPVAAAVGVIAAFLAGARATTALAAGEGGPDA
ncbi:MAG: hypothetical protein HY359_03880 [Candidatus Rokubacteria bacterium]|nr:hypothetical protein [Candidatus Rokubacteria bacterium]